jgi:Protein of unknown function (DUF4231)
MLAVLPAVAAAAAPILGRQILEVGDEAQWIRCRAIAEAIKSECFRFAACVGDYARPEAAQLFVDRRTALTEPATRWPYALRRRSRGDARLTSTVIANGFRLVSLKPIGRTAIYGARQRTNARSIGCEGRR